MTFVPGSAQMTMEPWHLCLAVREGKLVLRGDGQLATVAQIADLSEPWCMGTFEGTPVWTGRSSSLVAVDWMSLPERLSAAGVRAPSVVNWRAAHRYCGACREELADNRWHDGRDCPSCGLHVPLAFRPVVLVCITRGPEVLLVRHTYGNPETWAIIGGLVEAGESLEEAARREVGEEVGLTIGELTYAGSQPWHAGTQAKVLAAFTAEYASGEVRIDPDELAEARWFARHALPAKLPPAFALGRRIIESLRTSA